MLSEITVCLEEWSQPYPTGALAKDGSAVVDSDYCDTAREFGDFIFRHRHEIDCDTRLVFRINSEDIDNEKLMALVKAIRKEWLEQMWIEPEPEN